MELLGSMISSCLIHQCGVSLKERVPILLMLGSLHLGLYLILTKLGVRGCWCGESDHTRRQVSLRLLVKDCRLLVAAKGDIYLFQLLFALPARIVIESLGINRCHIIIVLERDLVSVLVFIKRSRS